MSTRRQSRLALGLALACLVVTSGCMGLGDLGSSINFNRAESVSYSAEVVSEAPEEATVISTNDDLGNASALMPLFSKAVESDGGYAKLDLRGSDAENVTGAMQEFPVYNDGGRVFYFEHEGAVLRVSRLS
ncbi:hypothetical protein [Halomarina oriensis]|uniref:Uncharacterized protein n=1 Tax=Halomarina oriensis TaxID=671145 RepID=A0A6B0GHP0_9EURY|nr:hypothetical protein [Halomarina oriensis]MWG34120.1 hypothetical protein [Halomarina oriensis]